MRSQLIAALIFVTTSGATAAESIEFTGVMSTEGKVRIVAADAPVADYVFRFVQPGDSRAKIAWLANVRVK